MVISTDTTTTITAIGVALWYRVVFTQDCRRQKRSSVALRADGVSSGSSTQWRRRGSAQKRCQIIKIGSSNNSFRADPGNLNVDTAAAFVCVRVCARACVYKTKFYTHTRTRSQTLMCIRDNSAVVCRSYRSVISIGLDCTTTTTTTSVCEQARISTSYYDGRSAY